MRPTVWTWNMPEEWMGRLRWECMRHRLQLRRVGAAECGVPLGKLRGVAADAAPLPFDEPMLLAAGLTGAQLEDVLRAAPVKLRAVLTPANARWDSGRLREELAAEAAALGNR